MGFSLSGHQSLCVLDSRAHEYSASRTWSSSGLRGGGSEPELALAHRAERFSGGTLRRLKVFMTNVSQSVREGVNRLRGKEHLYDTVKPDTSRAVEHGANASGKVPAPPRRPLPRTPQDEPQYDSVRFSTANTRPSFEKLSGSDVSQECAVYASAQSKHEYDALVDTDRTVAALVPRSKAPSAELHYACVVTSELKFKPQDLAQIYAEISSIPFSVPPPPPAMPPPFGPPPSIRAGRA